MKKIIIIFWIIILFIIVNIFSINNYYNAFLWEKLYKQEKFQEAEELFKKQDNYLWLYNLWNINYKLWEESQQAGFSPLKYWEKSIESYKKSLKIKYSKNTELNYNFVKNKLDKLKEEIKKQEEQKKKEEQEAEKKEKEK